MADLTVDLDGLEAFAGNLARIRDRLKDARGDLRGHDDTLGSGRVSEKLDRFEDHWRDGREKIESNCEVLGSMASQSVATFRKADADLAASLRVEG